MEESAFFWKKNISVYLGPYRRYPDKRTPEWRRTIKHVEKSQISRRVRLERSHLHGRKNPRKLAKNGTWHLKCWAEKSQRNMFLKPTFNIRKTIASCVSIAFSSSLHACSTDKDRSTIFIRFSSRRALACVRYAGGRASGCLGPPYIYYGSSHAASNKDGVSGRCRELQKNKKKTQRGHLSAIKATCSSVWFLQIQFCTSLDCALF